MTAIMLIQQWRRQAQKYRMESVHAPTMKDKMAMNGIAVAFDMCADQLEQVSDMPIKQQEAGR